MALPSLRKIASLLFPGEIPAGVYDAATGTWTFVKIVAQNASSAVAGLVPAGVFNGTTWTFSALVAPTATPTVPGLAKSAELPGNSTGVSAIAYPNVGYYQETLITSTVGDITATAYTNINNSTLVLQPGDYEIEVCCPTLIANGDGTAPNHRAAFVRLLNVTDGTGILEVNGPSTWSGQPIGTGLIVFKAMFRITAAKTIRAQITSRQAGGTSNIGNLAAGYFTQGYVRATLR